LPTPTTDTQVENGNRHAINELKPGPPDMAHFVWNKPRILALTQRFFWKILFVAPEKKILRIGVLFGGRSRRARSLAGFRCIGDSRLDPDKYEAVPIRISKEAIGHRQRRPEILPEVLRAGQRVVMAADPTDAAIIPLDAAAAASALT